MDKQTMLETLKLIALCVIIVCLIVMTVIISSLPNIEHKQQLEAMENELNQSNAEAQVLAEIEVQAHFREKEVLLENGRIFGWADMQEQIAKYNNWVIEKQTEVKVLGDKSPYYYTSVMGLTCIVGWGESIESVTQ